MRARLVLTAFGKEIGRIEREVASEAEADNFFAQIERIRLTMTVGDKTIESTPFTNMPMKKTERA